MKWKYRNNEESKSTDTSPIPFSVNLIANDDDVEASVANIKVVNNKVYFYGDVDTLPILELNKTLVELDIKLQNTKNIFGDSFHPIIELHVNTYGGGVFEAFSTVDTIRNLKSDVYTYADGSVASAGTLIIAVGKKRFIGEHAHILIHQLSSGGYGKFSEMEDEFYNCKNLMKLLKDFYKKHTKIPMKKLDELMKHDLWMNAEECLQNGVVDEII